MSDYGSHHKSFIFKLIGKLEIDRRGLGLDLIWLKKRNIINCLLFLIETLIQTKLKYNLQGLFQVLENYIFAGSTHYKGWSLKFSNFTGDSSLYLWKEQEFQKVEEVWPTLFSFLGGVILLQLFWILAPFRDIGRCHLWNWEILRTTL